MSVVVRISDHQHDPQVVLVHVPPEAARAMGGFTQARWVRDLRAYMMHRDMVPAFQKFAQVQGFHVVADGGGKPKKQKAPPPVECRWCGQPARADSDLRWCPNCEHRWEPIRVTDHGHAVHVVCVECGARQPDRLMRCLRCSALMLVLSVTPTDAPPLPPRVQGPRAPGWIDGRRVRTVRTDGEVL